MTAQRSQMGPRSIITFITNMQSGIDNGKVTQSSVDFVRLSLNEQLNQLTVQ